MALLFAAQTFTGCGVQFSYPATWHARANPGGTRDPQMLKPQPIRCAIGLRPPSWIQRNEKSVVDQGNWAVTIVMIRAGFTDAAYHAGFVKADDLAKSWGGLPGNLKPGGWGIFARQSVNPAAYFHTICCQALRGKTWGHERGREGQIVSVTAEDALLSRGDRSAMIEASDDTEFSDVLTHIIESFRFVR